MAVKETSALAWKGVTMINLQLLEQLVIVAQEGTLSKAAQVLLMSQPSLTRNMQNLEEELGVQLFKRSKNRLILTETGHFTVQEAQAILAKRQEFVDGVRNFYQHQIQLFAGICAPAADWELRNRLRESNQKSQLKIKQLANSELKKGLLTGEFHLIVTDFPIDEKGIVTTAFFKEQLFLSIHPSHPLAAKEEIELKDLADLTMLIRSDLGIWQSLVETLTQTKFIVQKDWETFEELIQASNLPCFSTNISQDFSENNQGRAHIPIRDPEATKTFYLSVLDKNKQLLSLFGCM